MTEATAHLRDRAAEQLPGAVPRSSLEVRGIARVEIVDGVPAEYPGAAAKSMKGDELVAFEAQVRQLSARMARISITPTWAHYHDVGAGRVPTFLRRLLDAASA